MGHWWSDSDRGNGSTWRRTCPSSTLSTINAAGDRSQDSDVGMDIAQCMYVMLELDTIYII